MSSKYECAECGQPELEGYKARDSVWLQAMPTKKGFLHLECLAQKLGRQLTIDDFEPDLPINQGLFVGFRIGAQHARGLAEKMDDEFRHPPDNQYYSTRRRHPTQMRIAVDFDETIAEKWEGRFPGPEIFNTKPIPGAFDFLRNLLDDGHVAIIHSVRLQAGKAVVGSCEAWFNEYGLEPKYRRALMWWLQPGKPWADVYLDDRGLRFTGTYPTREELAKLIW